MSSFVEWMTRQGARTRSRRRRTWPDRRMNSASDGHGLPGRPAAAAVAREHAADDPVADALVLDAVGKGLHEGALAADAERAQRRQQERQARDRRNGPAVVAERRAVEADPGARRAAARSPASSASKRAHRQARDEQVVDLAAQPSRPRRRRFRTNRASRWSAGRRCCHSGRPGLALVDRATRLGQAHGDPNRNSVGVPVRPWINNTPPRPPHCRERNRRYLRPYRSLRHSSFHGSIKQTVEQSDAQIDFRVADFQRRRQGDDVLVVTAHVENQAQTLAVDSRCRPSCLLQP